MERDSGYYGMTAIGEHAVEVLKEHQRKHAEKPFFHYLAFTAPHFPLHALPVDIEKYKARYQRDWETVRKERYQRQLKMGLHNQKLSAVERDLGPPYHFPDHLEILGKAEVNRPVKWDSLTEEQKVFQGIKMAIHAAMIDRMDIEIGKVLDQIRKMGELNNTLVFFLSDNGCSAEIMYEMTVMTEPPRRDQPRPICAWDPDGQPSAIRRFDGTRPGRMRAVLRRLSL